MLIESLFVHLVIREKLKRVRKNFYQLKKIFLIQIILGHLCFDANFESGNLGAVTLIGEFEYDLCLRPDTCKHFKYLNLGK